MHRLRHEANQPIAVHRGGHLPPTNHRYSLGRLPHSQDAGEIEDVINRIWFLFLPRSMNRLDEVRPLI